ncbi:MAG TPA: serine/threonine-protein kinase, partial [Candidatus Saccharimonadia bacterium]|nr:serine/threonine-protein kinase [Candidatus Saccharimonadia bacterium]
MTAPGRELGPDPGATVTGLFAAAELRVGELVAGRFRIEELIGLGGMGVVYRAYDEQLHVPVALKLLRPELASRPDAFTRFRQELLLARQVSSPHVVRIHDIVAHEGRWLISMDFVAGGSLERLLDERGALAIEDATKIARQLALGLAAAHARNVVHRDLKPANVLVTDALDAYITDFGIARSAGVTGITGSGVVVGTPEYLSPEQARADPIDHRSDLYALGLMLYEMLAGKPAFEGGTPAEMLAQRIVRNAPSVAKARPDAPAWLVRLVARLTQLKPARRLQHATDVVRALDERRVPTALPAPRVAVAALLVAVAAVAAFDFARRLERTAEVAAPAAVPAARTLRIAVFPTQSAADDAPLAAALDALLAETLAATRVPHANAARVDRALRQLGYDDATARRNRERVAEFLGADAVLEPALVRDGPRWRLTLERRQPAGLPRATASYGSGALTADALQPAV